MESNEANVSGELDSSPPSVSQWAWAKGGVGGGCTREALNLN
jgi:hypothetical protein